MVATRHPFPLLLLLLALPLPAQKKTAPPTPQQAEDALLLADVQAFDVWLQEYKSGAFRLVKDGAVDQAALAQVDERMARLAKWNVIGAAKMLFEAASVEPALPGAHASTEVADFHRELQPWRVQALAQKHLRTMTGQGIVDWLIEILGTRGRAGSKSPAPAAIAAVMRVFAGHPSVEAQLELLHACTSLPTELRVKAVDALSQGASLDTVPSLLDLLRDVEPNVRIAASNGLGRAMAPLVDETAGKHPDGELLKTRDQVIQQLKELLLREPIWQVRNAAAYALAGLKCKPVVPALIDGLKAELARKKDPWAMDMRLHRLLEGLTGQQVVPGDARLWEEFWKAEGPGFTVATKLPGKPKPKSNKYQKFFDLEIESDRVLFLVDFSGSMAEMVTLQATGSTLASKNGLQTTKAQLVVSELKRIVMGLPSGALLNFVVFSDEARCWREDRGRPALVKLDDPARDDLLGSFLDSLRPQGPTNLYAALDKAIEFAGRGLHDKYYEAGYDTLYVITDGAPSVGEVVDKDEIRRRVRDANRLRKLTIHCITFGDKNDTDFLRPLAEENGGRHIHIE